MLLWQQQFRTRPQSVPLSRDQDNRRPLTRIKLRKERSQLTHHLSTLAGHL